MKKGEMKADSFPLINRFPTLFHNKNDRHLEELYNSNLSETTKPVVWAHTDSWEEAEILQPILKRFAEGQRYTILTTYSPSLSDEDKLHRDYDYSNYLFPLPKDTPSNAESFLSFIKPAAALFAVSAYPPGYLLQLKRRNIPTFLIARKIAKPSFPGCLGTSSFQNALKTFTHIFIFDKKSEDLLNTSGIKRVTVSEYPPISDMRTEGKKHFYDRTIERFISDEQFVFIGGNIHTDQDLRRVSHMANKNPRMKCILAPHTISEEHLLRIKSELKGFTLLCSECDEKTDFSNVQVLVTDIINNPSGIYRYGSCAYVGGSSSLFLHNLAEATAHGLPTSFGPRTGPSVLPEYLVRSGISTMVRTPEDLCKWGKNLEAAPSLVHRINSGAVLFMEKSLETAHSVYTYINSCL